MGRICTITAAILLLTVSWVGAGTFQVLADAGAVRTPTPLYVGPGMVVKAEFKSNLNQDSELETESDALFPVEAPAQAGPKVAPKPAVTLKGRGTRAMAPPPAATPFRKPGMGTVAQVKEEKDSLELDLEKDLVISPPPPKAGDKPELGTRPTVKTRGVSPQAEIKAKKVQKQKAPKRVKRISPAKRGQYAASPRAIRKVRPVSRHAWSLPAGNYRARGCPVAPYSTGEISSARRIAPPPTVQSFVRDGVMVRLAPRTVPAAYGNPEEEEYYGSEILSIASEIIGMPFAFISSLF